MSSGSSQLLAAQYLLLKLPKTASLLISAHDTFSKALPAQAASVHMIIQPLDSGPGTPSLGLFLFRELG